MCFFLRHKRRESSVCLLYTSSSDVIEVYSGGGLDVRGGTANNITQHDGAALKVTTYDLTVSGTNSEGAFSIHNNVAENGVLL